MIFRIYSFKYSTEWGGVMVLYKLANDLIRLGHVVNMFDYDKKNIDNPFCNTYLETNAEENEIVIYPEIVEGNPLHAKRVVRLVPGPNLILFIIFHLIILQYKIINLDYYLR